MGNKSTKSSSTKNGTAMEPGRNNSSSSSSSSSKHLRNRSASNLGAAFGNKDTSCNFGNRIFNACKFGSMGDIAGRPSENSLIDIGESKKTDSDTMSLNSETSDSTRDTFSPGAKLKHSFTLPFGADTSVDPSKSSLTANELPKTLHNRVATCSFIPVLKINELEASSPGQVRTLSLNLLDGTIWALRYFHITDKFRHIMIRLRDRHGLQYDGAYSFFVVHDGLLSGELLPVDDGHIIQEEIQSWTAKQKQNDFLFSGGSLIRSKHLILRRRVYFRKSPETREALMATDISSMAHTLAVIDASYTFRRGWYHQTTEQLVELAALMYHGVSIQLDGSTPGDTSFDRDLLIAEVIPHVCLSSTPEELKDLVDKIRISWRSGIHKLTGLQSEQIFCQKLSKWAPWYGSIIFSVVDHMVTSNFKYIAVTEEGVYILTRDKSTFTKPIAVEKYATWSAIKAWDKTANGKTISITVLKHNWTSNEMKETVSIKRDSLHSEEWVYDMKAGNAVSVIDQMIEYSFYKKVGGERGSLMMQRGGV